MCVMSVQSKEAEDRVGLLELQLLMAVSCHLVLGIEPGSSVGTAVLLTLKLPF